MKQTLSIKRVYDEFEKGDGYRVLIDRLWPRGISKEKAALDLWPKELTPSNTLRKWYHVDREKRFSEFKKRYKKELSESPLAEDLRRELQKHKKITLITAAKDLEHSHVPVLEAFLEHD